MLSTFARTTTFGRMLKAKFYKGELKAPLKSTNMRSYITEGYLNFVWYRQVRSCVLCRSNFFSWICTASIVLHLHFPRIRLVSLRVDTRKFTSSVFLRDHVGNDSWPGLPLPMKMMRVLRPFLEWRLLSVWVYGEATLAQPFTFACCWLSPRGTKRWNSVQYNVIRWEHSSEVDHEG